MEAEENQRYQGGHTSTINVVIPREIALEDNQTAMIPNWGDVERYGMNQAEEEADIATPSVQHVEPLMANARQHSHQIGFHAECNDPWYHGDGDHSGSNGQWR